LRSIFTHYQYPSTKLNMVLTAAAQVVAAGGVLNFNGQEDIFPISSAAAITSANGIRLPAGVFDGQVVILRNDNPVNRELAIDDSTAVSRCNIGGSLRGGGATYKLQFYGGVRGGAWSFIGGWPQNPVVVADQFINENTDLAVPDTAVASTLTFGNTLASTDVIVNVGSTPTVGTGFDGAQIANWWRVPRMSSNGLTVMQFHCDLTDLIVSTTDLDIIGESAAVANCHFGRVTTPLFGAVICVTMKCLEVPAGGVTDIDLYSATEATGVENAAVTGLTETAIITADGAWTIGLERYGGPVVADQYMYLAAGAAGTPGTYTAGQFLITFHGTG
jgi:hypothetical protein